jgi:hypothetical protein
MFFLIHFGPKRRFLDSCLGGGFITIFCLSRVSKTEWLRVPNFDAQRHRRAGRPLYIQVYTYSGVHYKARHEFSPEFFLGKGKAILRKNQVTIRSVAEERLKALERTLCKARSIARHTGGRASASSAPTLPTPWTAVSRSGSSGAMTLILPGQMPGVRPASRRCWQFPKAKQPRNGFWRARIRFSARRAGTWRNR